MLQNFLHIVYLSVYLPTYLFTCLLFSVFGKLQTAGENMAKLLTIPASQKLLSLVQLFATPWTIQSMEFSRPEYWSG